VTDQTLYFMLQVEPHDHGVCELWRRRLLVLWTRPLERSNLSGSCVPLV